MAAHPSRRKLRAEWGTVAFRGATELPVSPPCLTIKPSGSGRDDRALAGSLVRVGVVVPVVVAAGPWWWWEWPSTTGGFGRGAAAVDRGAVRDLDLDGGVVDAEVVA